MPLDNQQNSDSLGVDEEMKAIYGEFSPLDILIAIQEFMDSINIFAYKNWMKGTIYEGPFIERYWIDFSVIYKKKEMPDPSAAMRLVRRGCDVKFYEDEIEVVKSVKDKDYDPKMSPELKRTATKKEKVWVIDVRVPRHLIDNIMEREATLDV